VETDGLQCRRCMFLLITKSRGSSSLLASHGIRPLGDGGDHPVGGAYHRRRSKKPSRRPSRRG
jgi:hypothetical protein